MALGAHVPGIDPVLGQGRGGLRVLREQQVPVVVEVADDRDVHAQAADLADDLGHRGGGRLRVHRDPDELGAGMGQPGDLDRGRVRIGRVRVRHRLDDDRVGAPDEHATHVHADRRAPSGLHWPPPHLAGDVEERHPDDERHEQAEADGVRRPLHPERDPLARECPRHEDEHAPAVERRDRQDVDEREVGRQESGQPERGDRALRPEDVTHAHRDADGPGDAGILGRVVDDAAAQLGQAVGDESERLLRLGQAEVQCRAGRTGERAGVDRPEDALDSERTLARRDVGGASERDRDIRQRSTGVHDRERDRLAGLRPQRIDEALGALEVVEALSVDRDDQVRRRGDRAVTDPDQADRCGRRSGLRGLEADGRRLTGRPGDGREDHDREERVHRHAGEQDDELDREPGPDERVGIVRFAVLALEPDEPAKGQPVQCDEGLALRAQDPRPGREPDPEFEDADPGEPRDDEMAELVDDHEQAEHAEEDDDRDRGADERGDELHQASAPRAAGWSKAIRTSRSSATSSSTEGA